jgi:hypothetical protein
MLSDVGRRTKHVANMKNTRRRVITFESRSLTIIYRGGVRYEIRCGVCGSESVTILPEGTDEEQRRQFESSLGSGACIDNACRQLVEAETLPKF